MSFAELGLSDQLLRAVEESGYNEPTPIQRQAIPPVLMGQDLVGIAQTGTGKTAAFVLPMIDILGEGRSRARMPRSLILEPTRELAAQVAENFEKYGKYHKLSMALLIGGVSMGDQVKALERGVDVLIATPGRLMDLFGRGNILLTGCSLLVIDEADRMLDMGFIPDIEQICTKLPANRQTLLFSATCRRRSRSCPRSSERAPSRSRSRGRPPPTSISSSAAAHRLAQEAGRAGAAAAGDGGHHRDHLLQSQDCGARSYTGAEAARLRRGADPWRHGAAGAAARTRPVQEWRDQHPGRLRRRRPRARHQGRQPRLQL
jgi:superfamily II DNA/RNA helicase